MLFVLIARQVLLHNTYPRSIEKYKFVRKNTGKFFFFGPRAGAFLTTQV